MIVISTANSKGFKEKHVQIEKSESKTVKSESKGKSHK